MKIGIMGGTFNPVHNGHIALAEAARLQCDLDVVWFMPSGLPGHKSNSELLDGDLRAQMVCLAIKDKPEFVFSSFELDRDGVTYTSDTLLALSEQHPEDEFYFLMGGDSLMKFHTWVRPEVIAEHATLVVTGRNGYSEDELETQVNALKDAFGARILFVSMPEILISSSEIRESCRKGAYDKLREAVPEDVFEFLRDKGIYSEKITQEYIAGLEKRLQETLKPSRYQHTLGVAYMAASLAMCHGISHREALVAGLLHDCAKNLDEDFLQQECIRLQLDVSEHELKLTQLLHAAYGAYLAEKEYHITNENILNAIRNHTMGRPAMTKLEQIIFLADYLEPERTQPTSPDLDEIRRIAFCDLDYATCLVLQNTLTYFEKTKQSTAPETLETFRYYKAYDRR